MKVVELLKQLSANEIIRFEKFLISPYHNEKKEINLIYNGFLSKAIKSVK